MSISKILAFLLNPKESHAQGTLYLDAFIKLIKRTVLIFSYSQQKIKKVPEALTNTFVYTEQSINDLGRLDLLLRNKEGIIVIENKFEAYDGNEQLERYAQWLSKQNVPALVLVYLNERAPSTNTFGNNFTGKDFTVHITYSEIIQALDEANDKVTQSGVKIFCKLFLKYLRGENLMNQKLINAILENEQSLKLALQIEKCMPELKTKIWQYFLNTLETTLQNQEEFKNFSIKLESYSEDPSTRYPWFEISITSISSVLRICFEFQNKNLGDLWWGIYRYSDNYSINSEDEQKLQQFMKNIFHSEYSNKYWIWGMWADEAGLSLNWNTPDVLYQMNEGSETLLFKEILDILNRIVKKLKKIRMQLTSTGLKKQNNLSKLLE